MFNFSNLNDVEFEYLCKDIMERKLGMPLQRFAAGRDGGVDLTDDVHRKNVVVQVKHFIRASVSQLISSLHQEVPKVCKMNPGAYYVCCSKELTPKNKEEIYSLFSNYMGSTNNIITLIEISDFLDKPENADILHKHFKLWVESTNIMTNLFSGDIIVDSDVLLNGIEQDVQLFVKTTAYDKALEALKKNNVLMIIGNPGVGKSMTSKMLVLNYAQAGYRIRYTTDGQNLSGLKQSLSKSSEMKEVILLDDCFGQAYFNMKETQENELIALIEYVKRNPNKILILNSRVTIYREAEARTTELLKSYERKAYKIHVLDMDGISSVEKALIFYNHLYFCDVPRDYCENIRAHHNFLKIVKHKNYNPRIIEYVCNKKHFGQISAANYADFVMKCLDRPEQIWRNEYERRLSPTDRILLTTLYSLTSTFVPVELVQACYNHRLEKTYGIDLSINNFEQSLTRLMDSMLKVIEVKGKRMLTAANPSVNDFIESLMQENIPEKNAILKSSISVIQLKRLLDEDDYDNRLKELLSSEQILSFVFGDEREKGAFTTYCCIRYKIFNERYKAYINDYLMDMHPIDCFEKFVLPVRYVIDILFEKDFCEYYDIYATLKNVTTLVLVLEKLDLEDEISFIKKCDFLYQGESRKQYIIAVRNSLDFRIERYCDDVPANTCDVDVNSLVSEYMYDEDDGGYIDVPGLIEAVKESATEEAYEQLWDLLQDLPEDFMMNKEYVDEHEINVTGSESLVKAFLNEEDVSYEYSQEDRFYENREIENIFSRPIKFGDE